jgi:hypothetical protein
MAGGKETPRQKMIGMMYLVLTALLALNVSKQILDAFVAIEENIQRGTITQLEKGNGNVKDLEEEMSQSTKDEAGRAKAAKIKIYLDIIKKINKETGTVIGLIDQIKMDLLVEAKEKVDIEKDNDENSIVWRKYRKVDPIRPARLNLMKVEAKDNFDIPMNLLVGSDIKKPDPSKAGLKLWKAYNNYRAQLVHLTGSYKEGDRKYTVNTKPINKFESNDDLDDAVRKMITGNGNKPNKEDVEMLVGIYEELTKKELANHHEQENIHWLGRTFDHAPLVGAIASLSSLQNEILSARAKAIGLLKGKVTTGQFSFNKIVGMGYTDGTVFQQGDEVILSVFMGAFDSDKKPQVKPDQGTFIESKDGIAKIRLTAPAPGQELKLTGMVAIPDKTGDLVWREYGKDKDNEIKIMSVKAGGSLEMPEYMVLYRGYDNKIIPAASGVVTYDINVSGCGKTQTTINGKKAYILKPGAGVKTVGVTLTGKDAKGKPLSFGTWNYVVKPFPKPEIKTTSVSKGSGARIQVGLPADSPLKNPAFQVVAVEVLGVDNGQCSGPSIPGSVVAKLKAGKSIGINVTVKNPLTNSIDIIPGSLKVTN